MEELALTRAPDWAWWIGGSVFVLVPAGVATGRLWFWFRRKALEHKTAEHEAAQAQQDAQERTALQAADELIRVLNAQILAQGTELIEVKARLDREREEWAGRERVAMDRATKCETDHANTRAILKLIALWAKKRGLALTPEVDRLINEDGSSLHNVVAPTSKGDQ